MNRSTPGLPVHHQLLKSTQTHVHQVGDAIQPSHPQSSPSPPALNLSQHHDLFQMSQLFASSGQSIGVSAATSVLPMISFRMNWLDLLAAQGTLQHHSSEASIFRRSAFFIVQLSRPYRSCLLPGCFASHYYVRSSACATQGLGEFGDPQLRSVIT